MAARIARSSAWIRWAIALGFGCGGFFDGILLHQILQWHHLLSLVPDAGDLRAQVLWDGLFHAVMYVIAAAGLTGLWRHRAQLRGERPERAAGALLLGFGLWHIADGVLSHWVLGLHRIRIDSDVPLAWDIAWLVLFGLLPAAAGALMLRRPPSASGGLAEPAPAIGAMALLVAAAAAWSLQIPEDGPFTTVVFAPQVTRARAIEAVVAAEARLVWADSAMGVIVVDVTPDQRRRFYSYGALIVSGADGPGGCLAWARP